MTLRRWIGPVSLAIAVAVPGLVLRFAHLDPGAGGAVLAYGAAIVGAAFLLTWAAESAQADISASLAIAILALIAVLPEYAVDLVFAFTSGHDPADAPYAAANMTGSNRLLIGFGWPLVGLLFLRGARQRREAPRPVELEPRRRIELTFLALASAFAFLIPLMRRISLVHSAVLLALFVAYWIRVSRESRSECHLVGVPGRIADLPPAARRLVVTSLFGLAAGFILFSAEPFARSLVALGRAWRMDEFLLVQWLAPLASESPELIVAGMMAWRGNGDCALGTLLSSKVNQWTLLVGCLPVAHVLGGGGTALPLDARQNGEFLLTAGQSALGLAVLVDLRFGARDSIALFLLFLLQLLFPRPEVRIGFAVAYLLIAAVILFRRRSILRDLAAAARPARARAAGDETRKVA